jgi:hypothetical protein
VRDATPRDLRLALAVVRRLNEDDPSSLPEQNPFRQQPGFSLAVAQHPAFAAYRSGTLAAGSSAALSDLMTGAALRKLPLYVDFYRPQSTVVQLLGLAAINGRQGMAVALNRSRFGFTRRDRELVDLLSPHLVQASVRRKRTAGRRKSCPG